jgi:competence protein ComEA
MEKVNEFLSTYKIPVGLVVIGCVVILGNMFFAVKPKPITQYPKSSLVDTNNIKTIKVDISGAVNLPGVYSFTSDNRIEDAIKTAQGFREAVNKEYVAKNLNMAQKLGDGMKIYIPFVGENAQVLAAANAPSSSVGGKIGINSASSQELDSLPGVGSVTTAKIIKARPFGSIDELSSKKIVGKSVYEKIKDLVDTN